jgi:ferritin-like metal-binding protein YciE
MAMALDSMQDLFLKELKDVLNAERQLVEALPRMAKAAQAPKLQQAFTKHLRETEGHVGRLERILAGMDQPPRGKACKGNGRPSRRGQGNHVGRWCA